MFSDVTLTERLVHIADRYSLSGLELVWAVNFEREAPAQAIAEAYDAIVDEYGHVSESIIDEIIERMTDDADNAND